MDVVIYILFGLALAALWYTTSGKKKGNAIPGPAGKPFIGCISEFSTENMHYKFFKYAEKFGDIVLVNVLGTNIVVLNTVELALSAFSSAKYKAHLNDRPPTFVGEHVGHNDGIVLTLDGNSRHHNELRKSFIRGFHVYGDGVKVFEEKVLHEVSALKSSIGAKMGQEFDLMTEFKRSISNLLSVFLSGEPLIGPKESIDENIFWDYNGPLDFAFSARSNFLYKAAPFIRFLPGLYKDMFQRLIKARNIIHERYLTNMRATYKKGTVRGLVDFFLEEQTKQLETGNHVDLTDTAIKAILLETVAAGVITTYGTLSNIFLCLVNNPKYQAMARAEINHVIKDERLPTLEDRANCPLTEAIIMETLRLIPTSVFSAAHTNNWNLKAIVSRPGAPWVPFGVGKRQCVGELLARSRIFLFTASLIQRWTFVQSPGKVTSCDPRIGDFEVNATMRPKSLFCRVE